MSEQVQQASRAGSDVSDRGRQANVSPPPTGEPSIDEALGRLDGLAERPLAEHHDLLSRAHEALHDVLDAPAPSSFSSPGPASATASDSSSRSSSSARIDSSPAPASGSSPKPSPGAVPRPPSRPGTPGSEHR